jgi:hypothetical protein
MKTINGTAKEKILSGKQASVLALKFLKSLPEYSDIKNVLLEEIELSRDKQFWNITLSYDTILSKENLTVNALKNGLTLLHNKLSDINVKYNPARTFKTFKVNTKTGDVESMKTRKIA